MRKILSTLLVVVLVVSTFATFGANAATTDGNLGPIDLKFSVYDANGETAVTTAEVGDVLLVKLNITNIASVTALKYYKITVPANEYLDYTTNNITLTVGTAPGEIASATSSFGFEADGDLYGAWTAPGTSVFTGTLVISFKAEVKKELPVDGYSIDVNAALSGTSYLTYFANSSSGSGGTTTTAKNKRYAMTTTPAIIKAPAAALPLVNSVKFIDKDATASTYTVTLNAETGNSYKTYVKDAVYGWTLASTYAPYTGPFSIKVTNPSNPFEIEVLESTDGVPDATPTFSATLAEVGQLDATVEFADNKTAYSVGETITVNADVTLPTDIASANYEIYFADSRKSITGTTDGSSVSKSLEAKRAGTYTVKVRFADPSNAANEVVKTLSYTVVENASANPLYFDGNTAFKVNGNNLRPNTNLNIINPSIHNPNSAPVSYSYRFVSPVGDSRYTTTNIPKPGVYHAYADIISGGVVADTAYTTITIGRDTNSVSITDVSTAKVDGTYTFTIVAENAQEYMFIRRDENGYRTVKAWTVGDNEWTWTPARDGTYEILAYAKRSDAGSYEAVKTLTIDVGSFEKKAVPTSTIKQNNVIVTSLTALAGKATTLTATLEAGTKVAYEIYDSFSNTSIYSGYGDGTFTFVPAKARTYKITTYVKADGNSGAYDNKTSTEFKFN